MGGIIIDRGKISALRNTRSSATVSTTNNTWMSKGMNPGLHGEKQASSHQNYGTTVQYFRNISVFRKKWIYDLYIT
jgi:hypothetical protein